MSAVTVALFAVASATFAAWAERAGRAGWSRLLAWLAVALLVVTAALSLLWSSE